MCKITIQVNCPYCQGVKVVKNGLKKTGKQNFLCRSWGKQFQREYRYGGCKPENKALVLKLLVRNGGIRDIQAILGVHRQTVLKWLNQKADLCQFAPKQQYYGQVQVDELWSFVKKRKKQKRWLFYAYAP
jgi:transposase-like protein